MNPYIALAALIAVVAAGWAGYSHGVENTTNKWKARENGLIARHAGEVVDAQAAATKKAQADADRQRAAELDLARKDEARAVARANTLNAQLRALREASDADTPFAACQPVPLPDGLRVEPAPAGPGSPPR